MRLSARILVYPVLHVSWSPVSDAKGYILKYTPIYIYNGVVKLVNQGNSFENIQTLILGTTYQISVYSYRDLSSESSAQLSVLYDV